MQHLKCSKVILENIPKYCNKKILLKLAVCFESNELLKIGNKLDDIEILPSFEKTIKEWKNIVQRKYPFRKRILEVIEALKESGY